MAKQGMIAVFLLWIALPLAASSAPMGSHKSVEQYIRTTWTSGEGLPENSVNVVVQASDGYLWLGTEEGLVRFNGNSFTVFNQANTSGFSSNFITALVEDKNGTLWIGTSGGLISYREGTFKAFTVGDGLSSNQVTCLATSGDGTLWIGTISGLNRLRGDRFDHIPEKLLPNQTIVSVSVSNAHHRVAVATPVGLRLVSTDLIPLPEPPELMTLPAIHLFDESNGSLWISSHSGLFRLSDGKITKYKLTDQAGKFLVAPIVQDQNDLWVGSGRDLCRKSAEEFECYHPRDLNTDDIVNSLAVDREHNIWVGRKMTGLERYKDTSFTSYGKDRNLAGIILSIAEAPRGGFLVTTANTVFSLDSKLREAFTVKKSKQCCMLGTIEDRSGNLWIAGTGGLWKIAPDGHEKLYTTADGLPNSQVVGVHEDRNGAVWIVTSSGVSQFLAGRFKNYTTADGLPPPNSFFTFLPWLMFEDHAGNMWFGSNFGLAKVAGGKLQNVQSFTENGIGKALVSAYEDKDGVLWMGTMEGGLKRLAAGRLTTYTTTNGLLDDTVWAILEDDVGNLWMSSDHGIFRIKKAELNSYAQNETSPTEAVPYGASDGMRIAECNGGSEKMGLKTSQGQLLFACIESVVAVTPKFNTLAPPVKIENVSVNGSKQTRFNGRHPVGNGDLTFQFAALSYVAPEKVRFKYKLEGYDKDWIWAGNRNTAYYTNLPPGQYRFRVIATNNDGVWNAEGASFSLYLEPHFYQTSWFFALCGLSVLGITMGIYRFRVRHLRARAKELALSVEERTEELQQRSRELEGKAKELQQEVIQRKQAEEEAVKARAVAEAATKARGEFLANMSHEIRTPLNGVIGMLELAGYTNLTVEQKDLLGVARESANGLLVVINDILDFSKIEAGKLDLDPTEFELGETLAEATRLLALRAHQKHLELAYSVGPELPAWLVGDAARLKQVLINLLSNAVKFTEHGEVVLGVRKEQERDGTLLLHFTVTDTGIGIPKEKQKLIFEAFSQADASTTRKFGGTGLGLTICTHIVRMMGGEIWVESEAGKGSQFHFTAEFAPAQNQRPAVAIAELRGLPVLVVDDNATNRRILEAMLLNWEMVPVTADSAMAGLKLMREAANMGCPFPLVLVDCQMPEMDGFQFGEHIQKSSDLSSAAIMMLTSDDYNVTAGRCRAMGIGTHLIKPVRQSDLLAALTGLLELRSKPEKKVGTAAAANEITALNILLAEDNVVNQKVAVRLLQRRGHSVTVANNGIEALRLMEETRYDLVLMDVQMPEMDGFEATAEIRMRERRTDAHIPIIAMTAHAMKGDRERCLAAGMDDYISKPINIAELQEAIARHTQAKAQTPPDVYQISS